MENLEIKSNLEFIEDTGEAFASVSLNPIFRWAKFILTDDKPNLNLQRIPKSEFPNLIRSGVHAPVKMAAGQINAGHELSLPIGVITNLIEKDDKILGLAALWEKEREEDVTFLKDMKDRGVYPQLSWEIYYQEAQKDESGIEDLVGTILRAATLVGLPAYGGRTPVLSIASQSEGKLEIEELEKKVSELETSLTEKDTVISELTTERDALLTEKEELSNYKNEVEASKAEAAKFEEIKNKFKEAGIEKEETYFVEKKESLLKLDEAGLEFMIQELVSFKNSTASVNQNKLPNVVDNKTPLNPKELGKALRENK